MYHIQSQSHALCRVNSNGKKKKNYYNNELQSHKCVDLMSAVPLVFQYFKSSNKKKCIFSFHVNNMARDINRIQTDSSFFFDKAVQRGHRL